jgi:hypothetical protein
MVLRLLPPLTQNHAKKNSYRIGGNPTRGAHGGNAVTAATLVALSGSAWALVPPKTNDQSLLIRLLLHRFGPCADLALTALFAPAARQ